MTWQEYAWRRLTEANPLPSVMGRVCPAPCESGCNRNEVEDFVGINSVEHFLGEYAIANKLAFPKPETASGKTVAVIGGGPAGLSAGLSAGAQGPRGDDLRRARRARRHDALRHPGLSHAARGARRRDPAHPRPRRADAHEHAHRHRRHARADPERASTPSSSASARSRAGRCRSRARDAPNCVTATAFLKAFNDGRMRHVGKRVVVVGGGDTSIDVATVARRLGHIDQVRESDRPENVIAGHTAHDVADVSARQGAEVTLTSIFADREDAGEPPRGRARARRGHRDPRRPRAGGGAARRERARDRRCA